MAQPLKFIVIQFAKRNYLYPKRYTFVSPSKGTFAVGKYISIFSAGQRQAAKIVAIQPYDGSQQHKVLPLAARKPAHRAGRHVMTHRAGRHVTTHRAGHHVTAMHRADHHVTTAPKHKLILNKRTVHMIRH